MTAELSELKARTEELAEAWEKASSNSTWHPPTCGCGASAGMPIVSMACAEADLLDFLLETAKARDDQEAVKAIQQRQRFRTFAEWIRALSGLGIAPTSTRWIEDRVWTFLDSLAPIHAHSISA